MAKVAVIAGVDKFLSQKLASYAEKVGFRPIRSNKIERILKELKQPKRLCIIDMDWEEVQSLSVLKQIVNVARITDNFVIAVAPNRDEDLKKLAKVARVEKCFIRFELETAVREFLGEEFLRVLK